MRFDWLMWLFLSVAYTAGWAVNAAAKNSPLHWTLNIVVCAAMIYACFSYVVLKI